MSAPWWTASAHDRVSECAASAALPQVSQTTPRNTFGRVVHSFLESVATAGRDAAIEQAPAEHRNVLERMPLELYPTHLTAEVAAAYDVMADHGRILATGRGRAYAGVADTEVCGTADVAGRDGGLVVVVDYKPRWMPLPAPGLSGQLRLLALALARAQGVLEARVAWCRYTDDEPRWEHAELSPLDLDDFAEEVREVWLAVVRARAAVAAGKEPDVHTGLWCKYCPALPACPAHRGLVLELARGRALDLRHESLTPESAGAAWARLQDAKRALGHIESALRSYAEQSPIVLPNGQRLGYVDEPGREAITDGDGAWLLLASLVGRDGADAAVSRSTSKKAMRDALRPLAKQQGRPLAHLERELHEELRASGAMGREPRRTLKVLPEYGGGGE